MNRNSHPSSATSAELRAQVEELRSELGHTVEALAAKADVKSRAQQRAVQVREQMHDRAARARGRTLGTASHTKRSRRGTSRAEGGKGARPVLLMKDKRVLIALAVAAVAGTVLAVGRHRYCHRGNR